MMPTKQVYFNFIFIRAKSKITLKFTRNEIKYISFACCSVRKNVMLQILITVNKMERGSLTFFLFHLFCITNTCFRGNIWYWTIPVKEKVMIFDQMDNLKWDFNTRHQNIAQEGKRWIFLPLAICVVPATQNNFW